MSPKAPSPVLNILLGMSLLLGIVQMGLRLYDYYQKRQPGKNCNCKETKGG